MWLSLVSLVLCLCFFFEYLFFCLFYFPSWPRFMYGHTYSKSMEQPGEVANPARGQLNRENEYFPVPDRAWKFGLAIRVRQSRPALACSSPYSGWISCSLKWFLPSSAATSIYLFLNRHTPSGQSRVYRVAQLRADGVRCRESTGTGQ